MDATDRDEHVRRFRLHFEGPVTRDHTLPAPALVQALQQFQRVVHLLAMAEEGREVRQRARVTHDIERRFPLVCRIPEDGGYALPVDLGDTTHQLFDAQAMIKLSEHTRDVIGAVNDGDSAELIRLIPDRAFRKGVVSAFSTMQPPKRSGIIVSIEDYRHKKLLNGIGAEERIKALLSQQANDTAMMMPAYVTGTLIEMKFQERRLSLQLLNTGRALEANYNDDFEAVLLDHPRDLIQVHGNVVYGSDDIPVAISDVDQILDIDDSPIEVRTINVDGILLQSNSQSISFTVTFDRNDQVYEASGPFGIAVGAETRPDLEQQIDDELTMLWREYATADPAELTRAAQKLRNELIAEFMDISDADGT